MNVLKIISDFLRTRRLFDQNEEGHMEVRLHKSIANPDSKVFLCLGDNAAGKSLFRQLLSSNIKHMLTKGKRTDKPVFEALHVSMETRASGGMRNSFMYSAFTDDMESTGVRSLSPMFGAFNTAAGREYPVTLTLDELELGLNVEYHWALGQKIAAMYKEHVKDKEHFKALTIVTHSKELVHGFIEGLDETPHAVMFGSRKDQTLDDWLKAEVVRKSMDELDALPKLAHARHLKFSTFFK